MSVLLYSGKQIFKLLVLLILACCLPVSSIHGFFINICKEMFLLDLQMPTPKTQVKEWSWLFVEY